MLSQEHGARDRQCTMKSDWYQGNAITQTMRNAFEKQIHVKCQRKLKIKGSKYPTRLYIQEGMGCLSRSSSHRWGVEVKLQWVRKKVGSKNKKTDAKDSFKKRKAVGEEAV